ncbi:MAG: hypothetical protein ACEPO8_11280 [Rhodothermaceae bacterium]
MEKNILRLIDRKSYPVVAEYTSFTPWKDSIPENNKLTKPFHLKILWS